MWLCVAVNLLQSTPEVTGQLGEVKHGAPGSVRYPVSECKAGLERWLSVKSIGYYLYYKYSSICITGVITNYKYSRGPDFVSQHTRGGSHPSVTPVSKDPVPSLGLHGNQKCTWYTACMQVQGL